MAKLRNTTKLSVAGVVVLALLAVVLSAAAMLQYRGGTAEPAPSPRAPSEPTSPQTPAATPDATETDSPEPSPTETETEIDDPVTESTGQTGEGLTVVVIGDSFSVGAESETWIGQASEALGWGNVVNLSSPGRGYSALPRACDFEPCSNFPGSVSAITDADPDVVITFGGVADGDFSITDAAANYFNQLRAALPEAHLVAISPVTTADSAAYWLTMHSRSITDAVESVDGIFIDVGQPGLGDGEVLSQQAHTEIADVVIQEMSGV